jgi:hypothetical protein
MRPTLRAHVEKLEMEKRSGLHQEFALFAISKAMHCPADAEDARRSTVQQLIAL